MTSMYKKKFNLFAKSAFNLCLNDFQFNFHAA